MAGAVETVEAPHRPRRVLLFLAGSVLVHALALAYLSGRHPPPAPPPPRGIEIVDIEVRPPPPPSVAPVEPEPPPEPAKAKPRPPPIKVATTRAPPPPKTAEAPPPPNEPAPAATAEPPPLVVGISMSGTTAAGAFAAPVGNTVYGKAEDRAADPKQVKGYSAPRYVPLYQVDAQPSVLSEVKAVYPEQARRESIEGTVTLSIAIDPSGAVTEVRVLKGPGHGLEEAAREALKKFKFKPATKNGEPVSTQMTYAYTFVLD